MSYHFSLSNRQEYLRENSIKDPINIPCYDCNKNIEDENLYVGKPKADQVKVYPSMAKDAEDYGKRKIQGENKHYHQACYQGQK